MSKNIITYHRALGIADFEKEGVQDQVAWSRSIDMRSDPRSQKLLPKTTKESGSVVTDLAKWGDVVNQVLYYYGDAGNFYKRSTNASHSIIGTIAASHGNGMAYYPEDDSIYLTSDKLIARYGQINGSPTLIQDYFGSQGGVPLNTNSLQLLSASSQYAARADTVSLSITGDLAIEAQIKPTTLPDVGDEMTLVSKWDESGTTQSYKFSLYGISGFFGDGSNGSLTISSNTTEAPIDSACIGTSGAFTLSATNASFAVDQVILIHQSQGTGAGTYMKNVITGYTAGTITLQTALNSDYVSGAQVRVLPQYTSVTVNAGVTYTAKAWNGTVGGILAFLANGTVTIAGTLSGTACGFRGGAGGAVTIAGTQGEGTDGVGTLSTSANGNGGGAGRAYSFPGYAMGGGGGGNGDIATQGHNNTAGNNFPGKAGGSSGTSDLTTATLGGGGGGGGGGKSTGSAGANGGTGGAFLFINAATLTVTGSLVSAGSAGGAASNNGDNIGGGGGGGGGGSILLKVQTATLGTTLVTAIAGIGGADGADGSGGGAGGVGRIDIDYLTSYTGTTTPTLNSIQDSTLVTTAGYQLRLGISSTGTNSEYLTKNVSLQISIWQQVGVSWKASTSTATFFLNAVSLGTATGTLTAIHDNASTFQVGMNKNGSGSAANFYNGLIDEVRLYNTTKTAGDFLAGINTQIPTNTPNLQAYYKFNGDYSDATANTNTLTGSGTPVFSVDVPFASPSTRLDIDQTSTTTGDVYTTLTAISESATNRKTFTPTKDPQKSLSVLVAAVGTGDWTLTIHDALNNVVSTTTVTNALMTTGYYEFIFSSVWRPVLGNHYHFHLTSTVADGTVTTTTNEDLETVSFRTYYQFLVTVSDYHQIVPFLNFIVILNERYLAVWDLIAYDPLRIILPSGWVTTCATQWNEYIAVGGKKSSTIYGQEEGRIWFWDGVADVPNYSIPVPEGAINAMKTSKGILEFIAGYQGELMWYAGGSDIQKKKRVPKITPDKYMEVMPGSMTLYRSILHYGVSGSSDSTLLERGVYSYGSLNNNYAPFLSYDYPISTGNRTASNIKVGMVIALDRKLFIGWQDNVSFGVDVVDPLGMPFSTGTIEYLIEDDQAVWKDKTLNKIVANFQSLPTGGGIDVKYKLDRETNWHGLSTPDITVGDSVAKVDVLNGRYNERQLAVDFYATDTSPVLLEASLMREDNLSENDY